MSSRRWILRSVWLAVAATLLATGACAADGPTREECLARFTPQTGQSGKDVIWVPTNDALVTRMLRMAGTTPADRVYDLGAGDGKIAIAAAKQFGATAVGVEYDPTLAQLGQCYAEAEGVADKVRIVRGDIFATDFSDATVVTLYLLPDLNVKLRPSLLELKPGTRVVSHSFLMGDWEPDERSLTSDGSAYLWIIPADVSGTWTFREKNGNHRFIAHFQQEFQEVTGEIRGSSATAVEDATLRGDRLEFSFAKGGARARFTGRIDGRRIEATLGKGDEHVAYVGTRS